MPQLNELWNTPKSWISAYNSRQTMHRQWRRASSTELENLTYNKINIDTSYQHHPYGDSDEAIIGEPAKRTTSNRDYTKGWRFGVLNCAVSASVVFLVNLVVTIWGSVHNKSSAPGILFDGDCGKAEQLNTGIHLLINGLSTILLSSSNYCMQCLSAPTRTEVNEAHAKGEWLDIGIPSVRNLRRIDRRRVYLWLLLGLSSLPLHLFYNSAVFSSIYSNSYNAFSVRQSFLDNPTCVGCNVTGLADMHAKARNGSILEKMDPAKCLDEYAQMIQATRRNVLLVASDDKFPPGSSNFTLIDSSFGTMSFTASNILLQGYRSLNAYSWICSGVDAFRNTSPYEIFCKNGISAIKKKPENWRVGESCGFSYRNCTTPTFPVQYCLSEKAEPHCKLQFSLAIAILVTILNFFKAALMFYVAYSIVEDPLITMGDAVASFLEEEDATTKGMCLLTYRDIKKKSGYRVGPKEWQDTTWRWRDVASKTRWGVTLAMFALALIVVGSLLGVGINALPSTQSRSLPALAQIGFGAIGLVCKLPQGHQLTRILTSDPVTIISWQISGMIPNTLMANLAQPILSFLYFSYNGVFTAMLLGYEWCSYSVRRKGLRLSRAPQGSQRSTYFLQLPYRFALPLMALSGVLHWLVSRSIFLVAIDFSNSAGRESNAKVCGYSPIAIIAVLLLGFFMTVAVIGIGYVPYKSGIPLAGSCSMAISAACHLAGWAKADDASIQKLQWGVVGESSDGVGHCAFSPQEVARPERGKVYAGSGLRHREPSGPGKD